MKYIERDFDIGVINMESTRQLLLEILARCLEKDRDEIEISNSLEDLNLDSFVLMDFLIQIEDKFNIEINEVSKISNHMESLNSMLLFLCDIIEGVRLENG